MRSDSPKILPAPIKIGRFKTEQECEAHREENRYCEAVVLGYAGLWVVGLEVMSHFHRFCVCLYSVLEAEHIAGVILLYVPQCNNFLYIGYNEQGCASVVYISPHFQGS